MLRVSTLLGNGQRLDGGAMFGNAPRALWQRWYTPDPEGRVSLACRALLVEDGQHRVLLEAGIGAFFSPELRERYGVTSPRHELVAALGARGLSDADLDVVLLSHLHFDHAGGLLATWSEGEPERLLFPNASFVVGRRAFERARSPHARDRASFIAALPPLLEASGRLRLVDPPAADAGAADGASLARSHPALATRFDALETDGHTPGMLGVTVRGAKHSVFFAADLAPGVPWLRPTITMGYDRFPELLVEEKSRIFTALADAGCWLVLTHDPEVAAVRLARDVEGRVEVAETRAGLDGWDLDA